MKKHKKIAKKKRTGAHFKAKRTKSAKPSPVAKVRKAKPVAKQAQTPPPVEQPRKVKLPKEQAAKYRRLLVDLRDHLIDGFAVADFLFAEGGKGRAKFRAGRVIGED